METRKTDKIEAAVVRGMLLIALMCVYTVYIYAGFAGGSGTEDDPWQIATAEQLNNVRNYTGEEHSDKHFLQTADIDLSDFLWDEEAGDYINEGEGWEPIGYYDDSNDGSDAFRGTLDGNGYDIAGLVIRRPDNDNQGLFGYTCAFAEIMNVSLTDVDITGKNNVGGLIGYNVGGIVSSCSSIGNISGKVKVGGLVGENDKGMITGSFTVVTINGELDSGGLVGKSWDESEISKSFSFADVSGTSRLGGLVGNLFSGSIHNCFSMGKITGNGGEYMIIGGLTGRNMYGAITNSYSTNKIIGEGEFIGGLIGGDLDYPPVVNSYWDIEFSGVEARDTDILAGIEGRTTAQMTYPYGEDTYVDWDFDNIWKADVNYEYNNGYPYLRDIKYLSIEEDEHLISAYEITTMNYPNPFNPDTRISFELPWESEVDLKIYNVKGQLIRRLYGGRLPAGKHHTVWDGTDEYGRDVSSGVYFYRLSTDEDTTVRKMLMVK